MNEEERLEELIEEFNDNNRLLFTNAQLESINNSIKKVLKNYTIRDKYEIKKDMEYHKNLVEKYLNSLKRIGRADRTISMYKMRLNNFLKYAQKKPEDVLKKDINDYIDEMRIKGDSNVTLEHIRVSINGFYCWLLEEEYIIKNPCSGIHKIKIESRIKKPFTPIEMDRLRDGAKSKQVTRNPIRNLAIIDFLSSTGCRVSELCNLKIKDINFSKKEALVIGKGNKQRYVFFNDISLNSIEKYINSRQDDCSYLFVTQGENPTKMSIDSAETMVKTIGIKMNVDNCHCHRFRRTAITLMLNRGASIEKVAMIMGHSDLSTTKEYYSALPQDIKMEYERYSY